MDIGLYEKVHRIALHSGLDIIILEDGSISLHGEEETVNVRRADDFNTFKVSYINLCGQHAGKTLKDCPRELYDWYKKLNTSTDCQDSYQPVPFFSSTFDQEVALEMCKYLATKIRDNDFRSRAN